jgi:NDP-sugar pyrophosphorylase family protein
MQAIIMAGGLGRRLRPFTQIIPKPLLPVGERSVLEITISSMKNHNIKEIFVALNYQSELFKAFLGDGKKWGIHIECSEEKQALGTAGPIKLFKDKLDESFIVMNGDILTNLDFQKLMDFHLDRCAALTIATKEIIMPLRYGTVDSKNFKISAVMGKPNIHAEVIAGIYACNKEVLDFIPDNAYFTMIDMIKVLLDNNLPLFQFRIRDYWLDIGQMDDYQKALELQKNEFKRN